MMSVVRSRPILQAHNLLGEPLWRVPAPNGFSDDSTAWMDGLAQRLDIANQIARRLGDAVDPEVIAESTFGPLLSKETKYTLARAESRPQAANRWVRKLASFRSSSVSDSQATFRPLRISSCRH